MSKRILNEATVHEIEAQIAELERAIERILEENRPENAAVIQALMRDIGRRATYH